MDIAAKMLTRIAYPRYNLIALIFALAPILTMDLIAVKFIEKNGSTLVASSNMNYAIASPKLLSKNWRSVSVNGDNVLIILSTKEKLQESYSRLTEEDRNFLEELRDEISRGNNVYTHVSSGSRGSNYLSSSDTSQVSSSSTSLSVSSGHGKEESVNVRDENNFSVARSDLPMNWSRVFFIGDLIAMVYRTGEIRMMSIDLLDSEELAAVTQLKSEVKELQNKHAQQVSSTMKQSMDMVSNVFNNIMGRFPQPPNYQSAVGNIFGDNFPFGPNNSPFASSAGWPFNGNGAFAYARAGRR